MRVEVLKNDFLCCFSDAFGKALVFANVGTPLMESAAGATAARATPSTGVARVSMRKCASIASRFQVICQRAAVHSCVSPSLLLSPSHRRHDAGRRLSIRAASSKASKVGRFPPTPCVDTHPLCEDGTTDLGEMCVAWRAHAGKPGTTVIKEVREMLRGGDTRRHLSSANASHAFSLLDAEDGDSYNSSTWRLLLSHKNENLYNAFALEVASMSPGSFGMTTGLFALPIELPESTLIRMAGLRAVVDPLLCASTAEDLIEQVTKLNIGGGCVGTGDENTGTHSNSLRSTPVSLYHDCVARHPMRIPSPDLYAAIGDSVRNWGAGFKHGMYARFKNPNDPESIQGTRETLRFCIIETAAGYIFGLTTYAPPRFHAKIDWSRKPNNYSAGTQPNIAAISLNAVLNPAVVFPGIFGEERDGDKIKNSDSAWSSIRQHGAIVDPCCGGGTILHAAWSRGYRAVGGDINPQNARNANGNLASFRRNMPAQHVTLRECDFGTEYAMENSELNGEDTSYDEDDKTETQPSSRPSKLLTPTPKVTVGDVITIDPSSWQANAKQEFKDPSVKIAAVVSNLPFGRQVNVGGKVGGGRHGEATIEELTPLLSSLKDIAPRHAFITGAPVADAMRSLGYENVTDIALCRHGRMFLTVAYGSMGAFEVGVEKSKSKLECENKTRDNVPRPSVAFTVGDAANARAENGYVYGDNPEWVEHLIKSGDKDRASGSRKSRRDKDTDDLLEKIVSKKPPLRVAVDTSYNQDSQRAIRSVAKQLSECIGVKRRARKDAAPEDVIDMDLTFAGWHGVVAQHAVEHFNAARWTECAMDARDVYEIFVGKKEETAETADVGTDKGTETDTEPQPHVPIQHLVYLSPDADEVLTDVDPDTMYVIGGIVDLAARGVAWSLPKANSLGIQTKRLPIREHLPSVTNQILNIDTVLKLLAEKYAGKDWEEALTNALPARQQGERPKRNNRLFQSAEHSTN